jgi:hypothetical protein
MWKKQVPAVVAPKGFQTQQRLVPLLAPVLSGSRKREGQRERMMESRGHASGGRVWGRQRSPQKGKPAEPFPMHPVAWGVELVQSSSGIITVVARCGSSISRRPQVAMNFTSRAARLSLRTYKAKGMRSTPGRARMIPKRVIQTISQRRSASSCTVTPGGTVT